MKRFAVLASVLIIATSSQSQAGWQGTEWGMSPKQVRSKFQTPLADVPADRQSANALPGNSAKLEGPYSAGDVQFRASFQFDKDDRLSMIRLNVTNTERCEALTGVLIKRYGQTTSAQPNSYLSQYTWIDAANKNNVKLFTSAAVKMCSIDYTPFASETLNKL
jgi:hypothetical protein